MSSSIPVTRRVTRATRTAVKDNENANARPSRMVTRTKPPSSSSKPSSSIPSKSSALTDANVQKRKREALGEVTAKSVNHVRAKPTIDPKGKGKEATIVKPTKPTSTTSTSTSNNVRAPLRTVTSRPRSTTSKAQKEVAIAVDHHSKVPVVQIPKTLTTINRTTARAKASTSTTTTTSSTTASTASRKTSQKKTVISIASDLAILEEPYAKRRRTSSEVGDDAHLEDIIEESEPVDAGVENIAPGTVEDVIEEEQDWDDLDRDDDDDPLMVSEYVADIFDYLKQVEQTTMPNPNYMDNQKELAWKMRGILMDWLIQVHSRFKLLPETLFLCVNLIDRFLSARVVSLAKLQLVGVTCMFIAAKIEETIAPSVTNFIYCADSSYSEAEILQAEKYILKTLDWNLNYPCPLNFLRRISKADDYNVQTRTIGKYLIEAGCLEWRLLAAPPSLLAASSMWLARLILDCPDWTPNLRHFSSYPEESLIPTANLIINYILKPVTHESFFKKYAAKRFMKASIYVREWALQRWEEKTTVNLAADLPSLKYEARRQAAENAAAAAEA